LKAIFALETGCFHLWIAPNPGQPTAPRLGVVTFPNHEPLPTASDGGPARGEYP